MLQPLVVRMIIFSYCVEYRGILVFIRRTIYYLIPYKLFDIYKPLSTLENGTIA